ncbi:MAG: hypothetical protein M3115_08210, partial [Thermoproteota archaeon]|nr:hypothetical protein [Thermoproteota archaeon]
QSLIHQRITRSQLHATHLHEYRIGSQPLYLSERFSFELFQAWERRGNRLYNSPKHCAIPML